MNGDDIEDIVHCFSEIDFESKRPHLLISHTTKGKGVSYMENVTKWHHGVPNQEEFDLAIKEISERIATLEKYATIYFIVPTVLYNNWFTQSCIMNVVHLIRIFVFLIIA